MLGKAIKKAKRNLRTCGIKISYYYQEVFGPVEAKDNAFAFEDAKLLEMARRYLATYERREAVLLLRNKKILIFTGQVKRPFTKGYEGEPQILKNLFNEVEKKTKRSLTQIERAFLEWELYNASEQRIIELVMKEVFEFQLRGLENYYMVIRLKRYFKKGETLWVKDLEDIFHTLKIKRAQLYKYVS